MYRIIRNIVLVIIILTILIVSCTNVHDKNSETPQETSQKTSPETPKNLRLLEKTIDTIWVVWDETVDATGYVVYWSLEPYGNYEFNHCGTNRSFLLENLEWNTAYFFQVTAYNDYGVSSFSDVLKVTTINPYEIIPEKPQNIRLAEKTNEIITVAWDKVYNAIGYKILWTDEYPYFVDDFKYSNTILGNEITSSTIADLQSLHQYFFQVKSFNSAGENNSYLTYDLSCITDEAYGTVTVWAIYPPVPDFTYKDSFYLDNVVVGYVDPGSSQDFSALTGYRELKLVGNGEGAGREVGINIYLTTDGYIWNNRYDYDWKNY